MPSSSWARSPRSLWECRNAAGVTLPVIPIMESSARRFDLDTLRSRLNARSGGAVPAPMPPAATPARLVEVIGGEERDGCHVISTRYEPDHSPAGFPLFDMWEPRGTTLSRL